MKQTIDEAMKVLSSYHNGFTGYASNIQDSIDVAVDIMHRYQKIEEIINNQTKPEEIEWAISEVLQDENDS